MGTGICGEQEPQSCQRLQRSNGFQLPEVLTEERTKITCKSSCSWKHTSPTSQEKCLPHRKYGRKPLLVILCTPANNQGCGTKRSLLGRDRPPELPDPEHPKKRFLKQTATHVQSPGDAIQTCQREARNSEIPRRVFTEIPRRSEVTCSEQMLIPCSVMISHNPPENKNPEIHHQMRTMMSVDLRLHSFSTHLANISRSLAKFSERERKKNRF